MEVQIISILCEGPHDVEFISRILQHNGYSSNNRMKISEYPSPIKQLFLNETLKTDVEGLNLSEVRQILIPSCTLIKDSNYFLIYTMGGDSKKDLRKKILNDFYNFIPKENEIRTIPAGTNLSIIYLLDADDKGIANRIVEINSEIFEVLNIKPFIDHKEIISHETLKLGVYVFTKNDSENGKLEDILMPLIIEDNEMLFKEATVFLNQHFDEKRVIKKFDIDKSTIGVAGQLQISGASNTVCIKKSDFITEAKVKNSEKCLEIFDFINSFTTSL